jgi:hypothetical protein
LIPGNIAAGPRVPGPGRPSPGADGVAILAARRNVYMARMGRRVPRCGFRTSDREESTTMRRMMSATARGLLMTVAFGLAVGVAHGGTVLTYTLSGTASGQLGATSFTDALVTYTAIADTSNIVSGPFVGGITGFVVPAESATIDVVGVGTATILVPVYAYNFTSLQAAGLLTSPNPVSEVEIFGAVALPALVNYDLATPIGPLSDPMGIIGSPLVQTTLGQLAIPFGPRTLVTFAATVPEPSTLVLAVSAALAGAFCPGRGPTARRGRTPHRSSHPR